MGQDEPSRLVDAGIASFRWSSILIPDAAPGAGPAAAGPVWCGLPPDGSGGLVEFGWSDVGSAKAEMWIIRFESTGYGETCRSLRAALVTGWYGAATTELPRQRGRLTPTWAPKGAIRCRYRDPSRCRAGRRPATGTTGHSAPEAGSLNPNGEAAAARILVATRRPGGTPRHA